MYKGRKNQLIQPEGCPRKFLLQLLSDLPLLFPNKNFSVVDKIYYIFFEKLNYSTAFFPVLLYYHYHHHCCQAAHYYCYDYFIYYYISIFKGLVGLSVVDLIKLVGRVLVTLYTVGEMSTASDFALH